MVAAHLYRDWDSTATSLGLTPKLDSQNRVVSVDLPEDPRTPSNKQKLYVVWVGRPVGLFHNWGLASAMVCGYSGAAFKAFIGLENAQAAWECGPTGRNARWGTLPALRHAMHTPGLAPCNSQDDQSVSGDKEADEELALPDKLEHATQAPPVQVMVSLEDWRDVHLCKDSGYQDYAHAPRSPLSASSTSIIDTDSWVSSGTLMPRTIVSAMEDLSFGERYSIVNCEYLRLTELLASGGSSSGRAATGSVPRNTSAGHSSAMHGVLDRASTTRRQCHDPVFVVMRGDHPGVYLEIEIALQAAGSNPAMKIVRFTSLKVACLYFVQQYMNGRVGVPVLVVDEDEAELEEI